MVSEIKALKSRFLSEEWLLKKGRTSSQARDVKIASGVNVDQRMHKPPGGLLRAIMEVRHGRLHQVSLSGDFFCFPQDAVGTLEGKLEGSTLEHAPDILSRFYLEGHVETPGVAIADWLSVLGSGAGNP